MEKALLLARVSLCFPKEGYSKLFQLSSGYTALSICLAKLKEHFTVACFLLKSMFNLGPHKYPTNPSDWLSSVLNIAQIENMTMLNVCIYVIITHSFRPHMERVHPTLLICSLTANSSKQFQASDLCASACRTLHKTVWVMKGAGGVRTNKSTDAHHQLCSSVPTPAGWAMHWSCCS